MKPFSKLTEKNRKQLCEDKITNPFISSNFLSKKYNVSLASINTYLKNKHLTTKELTGIRYRKYNVNDNYFEKINSHEKAYLLGVWYSDGYLVIEGTNTKRIGLEVIDTDWLIDIGQELQSEAPLYKTVKENIKRLKITSPKMYDDLIKLGCVEHKTFVCKFPTIKQVPEKYIMSFILGLSDGDGSIFITNRGDFGWNLTGTREICEGVKEKLNLTQPLQQRFPERNNNNYSLSVHGVHNVAAIIKKLYKNAPKFCLKRKKEKSEIILNDSRVLLKKRMLIQANPDDNGV